MRNKMTHYRGYFFAALGLIVLGWLIGSMAEKYELPLLIPGLLCWLIGSIRIADRNARLKENAEI